MAKKGLSLDEHRDTGRHIKTAYNGLTTAWVAISNKYPKASRAGKAAKAMAEALELLKTAKHEMDEQVVRDFPDLTVEEFGSIYYGPEK
jgi:2-oxo-4-hydroxy-4-carboxy--5-ureidoimidazoline (OHCU) decarboxylase